MDKHLAGNLVALESKLDAVLFARNSDEDEWAPARRVAGGFAAAGTAGAGAYAVNRYRNRNRPLTTQESLAPERMVKRTAIKEMPLREQPRQIGREIAGDVRAGASRVGAYGRNVASEIGKAKGYWKSARAGGEALGESVGGALKTVGKRVLRGVSSVKLNANQNLTTLGAKLNALLEFRDIREEEARAKGQNPRNNGRRSALGLGGGLGAGIGTAANSQDYRRADKVYRKRDALKHGVGGYAAGAATGIGGALALNPLLKKASLNTHIGAHAGLGVLGGLAGYGAARALGKRDLKKRIEAGQ